MTRTRWTTSAVTLGLIWLLGALVLLPHMQRDLEQAAQGTLAQRPALRNRLASLKLGFEGQQAVLSGSVRTAREREEILTAVKDQVRAGTPLLGGFAKELNPVSSVRNELEVSPFPPGWMMIAATGTQARLLGSAADEYEARDLFRSVRDKWSAAGGDIEGVPTADPDHHDEAANVTTTLRGIPTPRDTAQAFLTRIGQGWLDIPLQQTDEMLYEKAQVLGIRDEEWRHEVLPELRALRDLLKRQQQEEAERRRLGALPPGHLFIAVRDQQVVLRGEVGSWKLKRGVLDEALAAFLPRRVLDEIRVTTNRRPDGDFGPFSTALLPAKEAAPASSCFLGFSGAAWKAVDWQTAPAEQFWKNELPAGLTAVSLMDDSLSISGWLQGESGHERAPASSSSPAFLTIALFGNKAVLGGQVAEESTRTQFIAAARRVYGPPIAVRAGAVQVNGGCRPSRGILQTLNSLPPPPGEHATGIFAIAAPGGGWITLEATPNLVAAGGITRSKALPPAIPAGLVEELSADAIEQLRMRLASLKSPDTSR